MTGGLASLNAGKPDPEDRATPRKRAKAYSIMK
jgi:hypothetical protein